MDTSEIIAVTMPLWLLCASLQMPVGRQQVCAQLATATFTLLQHKDMSQEHHALCLTTYSTALRAALPSLKDPVVE
jgi:hypothetical protein